MSEENYTSGASGNAQLTEISAKLSLILTAVNEQTALLREVIGSKCTINNDELVKNIGTVMQSIETEMKHKATTGQQAAGAGSVERGAENVMESEAMRIKASIGSTWEQKLNARKDAYWAKTRNEGYLVVHQKWIQEGTPLIIPKKLQKTEIRNENENQRQLRERAVMQAFRNEIEMEKLRIESCYERTRKLDAEMTEIIKSRCSGQVFEFLMELWQKNIKRNEEISHKRWENTESWLRKYEEDFVREYGDRCPFFKKGNNRQNFHTYQQQQQQHQRQQQQQQQQPQQYQQQPHTYRSRGTYADAVRRLTQNDGNLQQLIYQLISTFNNQEPTRRGGSRRNRQNVRRQNNLSNNSLINENESTTDHVPPFLQEDHNWDSEF